MESALQKRRQPNQLLTIKRGRKMVEERRDNSIYVIGFLVALALIFYGLWTEEHPVAIEIVELVTNKTVEFLDPKIITRVNKEIVNLTATPGASVNEVIYATPAPAGASALADVNQAATIIAEAEATLRALTPVAPSPTPEATPTPEPSPTSDMYLPPAPSTMPPIPEELLAPTAAPAPPTEVPVLNLPPTQVLPTQVPPTVPPTVLNLPPTQVPPTQVPPTVLNLPPTKAPPTKAPPTKAPPTKAPPTQVPPTKAPPTQTPQALVPITPVAQEQPELIAPQLTDEKSNPEQPQPPSGVATVQGNIDFIDESSLTLILTNGDYYNSFQVGPDGEFWFEGVPNGEYNLSANAGGPGAGCAQIGVSVPEGHAVLTYNYRYYKNQCSMVP